MKARLLHLEGTLQLLLCTGKIMNVSKADAYEFLTHFDNEKYYSGSGKWDYENLTMESYTGSTIAFVDDNGVLHIEDAGAFRNIISHKDIKFLTVAEYAAMHGKQVAIVRRFCQNNRIPGAMLMGKTWIIPETSPYPEDERIRR